MAKKIINTTEITREQWLEVRRQGIGGSDAAAVCGENPWMSALELYTDKIGLREHKESNEAMRLGTDLEEYVAQRFVEASGKKVRRTNFVYASDEYNFIIADIDREVVGENAGLECKTMSPMSKTDVAEGEIPLNYYYQVQHYMYVMGYEKMYIAFLVYGKGFYWHEVARNDDFINDMISQEIHFWRDNIMRMNPPEADGSESSYEALSQIYPKSNENIVELPEETMLRRYMEISEIEKHLKAEKDEIKAKYAELLGDCGYGRGEEFKCSWKTQTSTRVDSKYLEANYPEVYKAVTKVTETRVFRVAKNTKKEGK